MNLDVRPMIHKYPQFLLFFELLCNLIRYLELFHQHFCWAKDCNITMHYYSKPMLLCSTKLSLLYHLDFCKSYACRMDLGLYYLSF